MTLVLQRSRIWLLLLLLIHAGALCCLLLSKAPFWIILPAGLAGVGSLIIRLQHAALSAASAVVRLWVDSDRQWYLQNHAGKVVSAQLHGDTFVSRYLVILNFTLETKRRSNSVILWVDSVDAHTFRRLKQYLLTQRVITNYSPPLKKG
ncbi:MAG TPA: protein YgfX [Gammaproteobacteria bacterium]|nr:protein YgfX [Gammaproteobacteria bacterium]